MKTIKWIIGMVLIVGLSHGIIHLMKQEFGGRLFKKDTAINQEEVDKEVDKIVNEKIDVIIDMVNKDLPRQINEITTLEKAYYQQDTDSVVYCFKITVPRENIDLGSLKKDMKHKLATYICETKEVRHNFKYIKLLKFEYKDKHDAPILSLSFDKTVCI